jgi:15-cis-phytoene synthase
MLSPIGEIVRRHDPDRFLTALFAPPERREALLTLYAFNHEIARAREVASQPLLALIRLQWWREVVEGESKPHEVATPLAEALAAGRLSRPDLLALIAAREIEVEGEIAAADAWRGWLFAGAGGVSVAAGQALGVTAPEALEGLKLSGAAYGVAGLLRSRGPLGRRGWAPWPADRLALAGLTPAAAAAAPSDPALVPVLAELAGEARGWLREARGIRVPRAAVAALLPGVLARRDLRSLSVGEPQPRGLADRAAVAWAALSYRP